MRGERKKNHCNNGNRAHHELHILGCVDKTNLSWQQQKTTRKMQQIWKLARLVSYKFYMCMQASSIAHGKIYCTNCTCAISWSYNEYWSYAKKLCWTLQSNIIVNRHRAYCEHVSAIPPIAQLFPPASENCGTFCFFVAPSPTILHIGIYIR